jgi:hypothetical protein
MTDLSTVLGGYLALRRSLGYKLERAGQLLTEFVAYLCPSPLGAASGQRSSSHVAMSLRQAVVRT